MPRLEEKVAFLSRPENYPEYTQHVETKQTHMSWIFLTDIRAWKLKKPTRFDHLSLNSPEARRRHCEEEVRLNQRLAANVYRGVVPLVVRPGKVLELGGPGVVDDWLVCMRRLPSNRMLDQAIVNRSWSDEDLHRVGTVLSQFYLRATPVPMSTEAYINQLKQELQSSRDELVKHALNSDLIESTVTGALRFIDQSQYLFDERVRAGKIIEAHGDLRPEHICLEPEPVVIDCLEFNRRLRMLDAASELMFLELECDRLGGPQVGERIRNTYCERTKDYPAQRLLAFYRNYHASVRAKVAIWHLNDHAIRNVEKWTERAEQYLQFAA